MCVWTNTRRLLCHSRNEIKKHSNANKKRGKKRMVKKPSNNNNNNNNNIDTLKWRKKERNKWIEDNKNRISSISYVGIETCFSCIRAFKRLLFYIHIFLFLVSCSFLTSSFWHESLQQNYKMYLLPENSFFFRLFHFSLSLHVRLVFHTNQKFIKCKRICFVSFCILSLSLDTFGLVSFDRIHFFSPLHDRFLCERVWVRFLLFSLCCSFLLIVGSWLFLVGEYGVSRALTHSKKRWVRDRLVHVTESEPTSTCLLVVSSLFLSLVWIY